MYAVSRSDSAQRVIAHLSPRQLREYEEIEGHLAFAFRGFLNDGVLVQRSTIFGKSWLRYFDNVFPFMIYLELGPADDYGEETLLIHAIIEVTTRP